MATHKLSYNQQWRGIKAALEAGGDASDSLVKSYTPDGKFEITNTGWKKPVTDYETDFSSGVDSWTQLGHTGATVASATGPDGTAGWLKVEFSNSTPLSSIVSSPIDALSAGKAVGDLYRITADVQLELADADPVTVRFQAGGVTENFEVAQDEVKSLELYVEATSTSRQVLFTFIESGDQPKLGDTLYLKNIKVEHYDQ